MTEDFRQLFMSGVKQYIGDFWRNQLDLLKRVARMIALNLKPILGFSLVSLFLNLIASMTVSKVAVSLALRCLGEDYVSLENLLSLTLTVPGVIALLFVLLCLSSLALFQFGGYIHAAFLGQAGHKATFVGMCAQGFDNIKRTLLGGNVLILVFMALLMPFAHTVTLASASLDLSLPEFIGNAIFASKLYSGALIAVFVILFLIAFLHIYSIPKYVIERKSFIQAFNESRRGIGMKFIATPVALILTNVCFTLLCVSVAAMLAFAGVKITGFFLDTGQLSQQVVLGSYTINAVTLIGALMVPSISMSALTVLYIQMGLCEVDVEEYRRLSKQKLSKPQLAFVVCLMVACVACSAVTQTGNIYYYSSQPNVRPEIVAHRGESINAPENSSAAFERAIEHGTATWVELDVHQTSDGVIVVTHDENLRRISGQNINVSDITYEELCQLDTGSWFSSEYSYIRCMTLDEALKLMRGHVSVQIEIKPEDKDVALEEGVIRAIRDNGMEDDVLVISLHAAPLQRIKELDPSIRTAYCMSLAWGDIQRAPFSDDFSIEASCIDAQLVERIHASGKKVFAWTCNTEDNLQYLLDCGVDGIVTDDPSLISSALDKAKYSGGVYRWLRIVLYNLANGI